VYFDVGVASSAFKPAAERTLGDRTILPGDAQPVGRIVLGARAIFSAAAAMPHPITYTPTAAWLIVTKPALNLT
jgi:hypothetical protein